MFYFSRKTSVWQQRTGQLPKSEAAWTTEWKNCCYFWSDISSKDHPKTNLVSGRHLPTVTWLWGSSRFGHVGDDVVVPGQCLKVLPAGLKRQQKTSSCHLRREVYAEAEGACSFGRHRERIRHTLSSKLRRNLQWVSTLYSDHGVYLPKSRDSASRAMKGANRTWRCTGAKKPEYVPESEM